MLREVEKSLKIDSIQFLNLLCRSSLLWLKPSVAQFISCFRCRNSFLMQIDAKMSCELI